MNLARIRFLSLMNLALYKVQTVNFEKLATAFDCEPKGTLPYEGYSVLLVDMPCLLIYWPN